MHRSAIHVWLGVYMLLLKRANNTYTKEWRKEGEKRTSKREKKKSLCVMKYTTNTYSHTESQKDANGEAFRTNNKKVSSHQVHQRKGTSDNRLRVALAYVCVCVVSWDQDSTRHPIRLEHGLRHILVWWWVLSITFARRISLLLSWVMTRRQTLSLALYVWMLCISVWVFESITFAASND